ncbi:hypothetical protein ACFYVE_17520 [Streptomyces tendae]|uniref:hypothetical protein n=1 Tax=Streptomyces tendae TaxID=1932 RepID=UPI003678EE0C
MPTRPWKSAAWPGPCRPRPTARLRLGSDLADVLLIGATTAMVEGLGGVRPDRQTLDRRRRHGWPTSRRRPS